MKENTGKTKYVLLGLLARGPQTGYTVKKAIEYEYSHFWQESFGQIYPTLKYLVEEGFAVCRDLQEPKNGRGQISYAITEKGEAELKKWLMEPPDVEKLRYEILLKVSFGSNHEPEIVLKHLEDFINRNEKAISEMEGFLDFFRESGERKGHHINSELTALCGKYFYTAMKDWAEEAVNIIKERRLK